MTYVIAMCDMRVLRAICTGAAGYARRPAATAYAGSSQCHQCHAKFYQRWATSLHGLAMQPYTSSFVREPHISRWDTGGGARTLLGPGRSMEESGFEDRVAGLLFHLFEWECAERLRSCSKTGRNR